MKRFFHPKKGSAAFRREQLRSYDGLSIRYVTEQTDLGERVCGKNGFLCLKEDELLVLCEQEILYRFSIDTLFCSELLSGNGVILSGMDTLSASEKKIVAYFSYHRK